jgi:hypothetical protein
VPVQQQENLASLITYMLDSMSHARHILLITESSDIDVHRGARFVRLWVMYQQYLELVRQADNPVCTVVQRGLFQLVRHKLNALLTTACYGRRPLLRGRHGYR